MIFIKHRLKFRFGVRGHMYSRLIKAVLSVILCVSFIPLAGIGIAFAEEGLDDTGLLELSVAGESEELSDPKDETATIGAGESEGLEPGEGDETFGALETEPLVTPESESEAIVPLADPVPTYSIEYRAHVQNVGWQSWVKDGKTAGTTGRSLQAEAISIKLTGEIADYYDISYRVHSANLGWLGWTSNGKDAGTEGYGYRMEAIEIKLVAKGTAKDDAGAYKKRPMALEASAHVQNIGWQAWVEDGKTAGTTGRSLRVEALCLRIVSSDYTGSVEYRAHVQNDGWQAWKSNGVVAGTTGRSLQMEAIQIRLSGEIATKYDIYYRVHIAQLGWLGWATDGQTAGTVGLSCRIEAIQVLLVLKGGAAPGSTADHEIGLVIGAQANVSGKGWLSEVSSRAVVGTTGQSRQMEAFRLRIISSSFSGSIEYNAHISGTGWQSAWVKENEIAGIAASGKQIEAIRIRLTGDLANKFDVYYRAHVADWGWLGWAKNGANAGTATCSLRMEAFEIAVTVKGDAAPGTTSGAYWESPPIPETYRQMNLRIANYSSPTSWLIAIDTTNCLFGVYYGSKGNWTNRYMWLCSPGTKATPTVKGTFSVGSRGYVFGSGYSCYYWTQIYGDYLIHSVLYYPGTNIIMEGTMGVPGSHGCVRLDIQNAKWIYDNIPSGTTIVSY
jgi:uncharacterized protein YjdB